MYWLQILPTDKQKQTPTPFTMFIFSDTIHLQPSQNQ